MKKLRKLFSIVIVLTIILTSLGTIVFADSADLDGELGESVQGLTNINVRLIVMQYFVQREKYLMGTSDLISVVVEPMTRDEEAHRSALQEAGIIFRKSDAAIDSISCWDTYAEVVATERISYEKNSVIHQETIRHEICVYLKKDGFLVISQDGYFEDAAGFASCSYVPDYIKNKMETMALGGSKHCLIDVAKREVGYKETPVNITKYGKWFDKDGFEWCAMFVAWCANQAGIPETVIPKKAGCEGMQQFFNPKGRFYFSRAYGGSFTPQPGDLYFERGSAWSPDHMGMITSVTTNYIYVIDGNCNDQVRSHTISLTASDLIGFARPDYGTTTHQIGTSWSSNNSYHWKGCIHCGYYSSRTAHTFVQQQTGGVYTCTVCGYKTYNPSMTYFNTFNLQAQRVSVMREGD